MKTRNLLLTLITIFIALTAVAQTSIGIPVQGIARDANGAARIDTPVNLTFDLYYIEGGNEVLLYSPSQVENLTTDSFGVFSTIVNTAGRRPLFGSKEVFLRISESGTVISNEQLNSVPYAIAANNGVPTGAVMPFVGATAPEGWLLCDGAVIPDGLQYDALKTLYGNNTPDMRGMFLRGAGTNNFTTTTTTLNGVQDDVFGSHGHSININTSTAGNHSHQYNDRYTFASTNLGLTGSATSATNALTDPLRTTGNAGNHTHNVSGNTAAVGQNETRPVNYGVNYIIKL